MLLKSPAFMELMADMYYNIFIFLKIMVKYTWHKIYHLGLHFSGFRTFTVLLPSPPSSSELFSSCRTEALYSLKSNSRLCLLPCPCPRWPSSCAPFLWVCALSVPHTGGTIQCVVCPFVTGVSLMMSSALTMRLPMSGCLSLGLGDIPLCAYVTSCLSVHP